MIEFTTPVILAALLSGAVIGLFLGTFGGGGSVLAAPLLLYAVGITDPHLAIGTSAAAVSAIALVSLTGHWRARRVKWPCATVFALAGIIGSLIGSTLALRVDGDVLLFAFAFAMAGMNPTAVASAGKMTSVTSMGIMLPVASSGAILMPWVIGRVAEGAGLAAGMATNIIPCVGLCVFAVLVARER